MHGATHAVSGWLKPNKMRRLVVFLFCISTIIITLETHGCTVFYACIDQIILAGNNEDWSDSNTKMWVFPATDGTLGWIKFGYKSGFPQGGVNQKGLFWDGTSNPWLDMPYSENNKIKLQDAIMGRVIEEASNIEEAKSIFEQFYCDDQYKAQYLLGDSSGNSLIVEGDNVLEFSNTSQVLTNFYHSHPELGGYPCWRYETATSMLDTCSGLTVEFMAMVLSATHQEGKYSTQYSIVYDLKNLMMYLFNFHNYEEYIVIDVEDMLKTGAVAYDIPPCFSNIQPVSPFPGDKINANSVRFSWYGKATSSYQLHLSTDKDFNDFIIIKPGINNSSLPVLIVVLILTLYLVIGKNKKWQVLSVFLLIIVMSIQCQKDDEEKEQENLALMSETVEDLEAGVTYFWKILATTSYTNDLQSETAPRMFTVEQ